MNKQTRKYIESNGPEFTNGRMITGDPRSFNTAVMTDGNHTVVQLLLHGEIIAYGVAKRHPGDKHNRDLGMALALTRAFTAAATRYAQTVEGLLNGDDMLGKTSNDLAKSFRESNRKFAREAKDKRRAEARRLHRKKYGWDHTDRPQHSPECQERNK